MPVGVLTHKNSLISKESHNKLLDRTEAIFDSDTPMDPGPKLKKKDLCKKIELCGVPIGLLTEKKSYGHMVENIMKNCYTFFD